MNRRQAVLSAVSGIVGLCLGRTRKAEPRILLASLDKESARRHLEKILLHARRYSISWDEARWPR